MQNLFNFSAFGLFLLYLFTSIAMVLAFVKTYTAITPYDEIEEIKNGRVGPAVTLSCAMLGFAFPLCVISSHSNYVAFLLWGALAGVVQLGIFYGFYQLAQKRVWDDMMEDRNMAACIFYGALSLAIGLLNAFSLVP